MKFLNDFLAGLSVTYLSIRLMSYLMDPPVNVAIVSVPGDCDQCKVDPLQEEGVIDGSQES